VRLVVATQTGTSSDPAVGIERSGIVYELFVSTLSSPAFIASDVLDLYLHRGSFEAVLADEDIEQDADRWYSHTPCGQEFCPDPRSVDLEPSIRTGALERLGGLLLILFGIVLSGLLPIPWLSSTRRIQLRPDLSTRGRSGLSGLTFGTS
jgi:hypothetical protein